MKTTHSIGLLTTLVAALATTSCVTYETEDGGKKNEEEEPPNDPAVQFVDANLETCVREHLGIWETPILKVDAAAWLPNLACQDRTITDLSGLEHFTGLQTLTLWENEITDLTPIGALTGLVDLQLGNNNIVDLTPLANLPLLQKLGLSINGIADLTPLTGLVELRWLNLDLNQITDIWPIAQLPNLQWVTVDHNPIGSHPALTDLDARGVIVYADFPQGAVDSHPDFTQVAGPDFGRELRNRGKVALELGPEGKLSLNFDLEGTRYPVFAEFGDSLEVVDGKIHYRTDSRDVVVGTQTADGFTLCSGGTADVCHFAVGAKASAAGRSPDVALAPVFTAALTLTESAERMRVDTRKGPLADETVPYGAVNWDVMPFILASPNQFDGGSCLFMATTGVMETLMNQVLVKDRVAAGDPDPLAAIQYEGPTDLSERYLMNAFDYVPNTKMNWWLSDVIYTYNELGGSLLNTQYPYTMCPDGEYISAQCNWDDELPVGWNDQLTPTPLAERTSIFIEPRRDEQSQWAVALMNDLTVEQIKYELRTKKAPVIIVYNHFLYWHADVIVGYDDTETSNGCPMVDQSLSYYEQEGATSYINAIESHQAKLGGCTNQGIFYVRDSIYDGGADEPTYGYGGAYSEKYSKRIVERSYNWVKFLANHAYTVHRR